MRDKRQLPKYSLKTHMLRKHPVLKFFATGPMDQSKTPYKMWYRVCRVELSLISRGVLELLSHFKTDAHLIKEHRIRLENPGLPLFDRTERELVGNALKEAKMVAKVCQGGKRDVSNSPTVGCMSTIGRTRQVARYHCCSQPVGASQLRDQKLKVEHD